MREMAESVSRAVAAGAAELQALHGSAEHAHVAFMSSFYRGRPDYCASLGAGASYSSATAPFTAGAGATGHRFLVPAFALACGDKRLAGAPSLQAKTAVFFALALREGATPPELFAQTAAALTLAPAADVGLVMAVMRLVDTSLARAVGERLALSVRRSGSRALVEAGQHVARVPLGVPVEAWPLPCRAGADAAALLALGAPRAGDAPTEPFEVTGLFAQARVALPLHDYVLVSSMSVLEAQWAAFYATGDARFVRRVCDIASGWAETAEQLPEAVTFLLDATRRLPAEVAPDAAACTTAGEGDKAVAVLESARSARAHVSRAAAWSLLAHARRHPRVTEVLAAECSRLAHFAAEQSARDEGGAERAALTEAEARARLEVLPALLHLAARAGIDASVK